MKQLFVNSFGAKRFFRLLPASIAVCALTSFFTMCNGIVTGRILGERALIAVDCAEPLIAGVMFLSYILGIGTSIVCAKTKGAGDKKKASQLFTQGLIAVVFCGVLVSILCTLFLDELVPLLGASAEYLSMTRDFLLWTTPFLFALFLFSFLLEILISEEDMQVATLASGVMIVLKLVLSIVLAKRMGLQGMGLSTTISMMAALLVCCVHFFRKDNELKIAWHFNLKELFTSFKYSSNDSIYYAYCSISLFIINRFIMGHFGHGMLAVYLIIYSLQSLLTLACDGIGGALQPLICTYAGEGNVKGIRSTMKAALKAALLLSAALCAFLLCFAGSIPRWFGILDPRALQETAIGIRLIAAFVIFASLNLMLNSYYTYVDQIILSVANTTMRSFVFLVAFVLLFGTVGGFRVMFLAIPMAELCALLVTVVIAKVRGKRGILFLDRTRDAKSADYNFLASEANVVECSQNVISFLTGQGCSRQNANRAGLIVEEIGAKICRDQKKKNILIEVSVFVESEITIVFRDEDQPREVLSGDAKVESTEDYCGALLLEHSSTSRVYFANTEWNRNIFIVK